MYHKWKSYEVWFLSYWARQNFLSFWTIFCPFTILTTQKIPILKKWKIHLEYVYQWSYDVWFLRYGTWQTKFFVILARFFALLPPNNLKKQNFEKVKKIPGCIIILHMCTIIDNHMMYGSWDIKHNRENFLSAWTICCPFTNQKIKILKKWKKHLRYYFTQV